MNLRILDDAWDEIQAATKWYESKQSGLGQDLAADFNDALQEISRDPDRFPRVHASRKARVPRRYTLTRFPYSIIFERVQSEIVVVAVTHAKRRPNYWKRRAP